MSQFISSAVAGKKAAPKAPVRRRQPPPKAAPVEPPPTTTEDASNAPAGTSSAAPPSPPQTQAQTQPESAIEPPSEPEPSQQQNVAPAVSSAPLSPPQTQVASRPEPVVETRKGPEPTRQSVNAPSHPATSNDVPEQSIRQQSSDAVQHTVPAAPMTAQQAAVQPDAIEQVAREENAAPVRNTRKRKSDTVTKQPAKKQKRSSARSNAQVQAEINEDEPVHKDPVVGQSVEGEGGDVSASGGSIATKRTKRARAAKATVDSAAKAAPKKRRKVKSAAVVTEEDDAAAEAQAADEQMEEQQDAIDGEPSGGMAAPTPRRRRKKKKPFEGTNAGEDHEHDVDEDSSDPELHEIDPNTLSMYELTHYNRYGKVSDREKKMREINWKEVKEKREAEYQRIIAGGKGDKKKDKKKRSDVVESTEGPDGTAETAEGGDAEDGDNPRSSQPPTRPNEDEDEDDADAEPPAQGLQLRIVNGVIVEDEASLAINRPAPDVDVNDGMIEEDNDLTRRLNRTTYINNRKRDRTERVPMYKAKSNPWTDDETERFYEQLAIFGTDFDILSRMFPGKNRRQLKTKFNREEKLDAQRINDVLLGKTVKPASAMNLQTYADETGRDLEDFTKFESAEHADEVIRDSMREREEAMREAMVEEEENARQAKIAAEQKEKVRKETEKKRAGKKRGKKGMGTGTLGGVD
ncbi:hypothetical protein LTR10_001541 [Elasticomyces elasticus]|nr:hypothetical protein LTR10_001541 [Elasticomyces elasticus]KAK4975046.1 hypothetical protein LTR42_004255 [Elasticomyces elasticus]